MLQLFSRLYGAKCVVKQFQIMILSIYGYGQPVLKRVAENISPDYPELNTSLLENMFETMYNASGVTWLLPR
ncbi:MAG: hypothetical protein R2784_12870 [Saprospiraceae bacterium]